MDINQIINSSNKEIYFQPNNCVEVTPSDTVDNVPNCPVTFFVGGNVQFLLENQSDNNPIIVAVANGYILACRVRRILASYTTAQKIVAFYNSK